MTEEKLAKIEERLERLERVLSPEKIEKLELLLRYEHTITESAKFSEAHELVRKQYRQAVILLATLLAAVILIYDKVVAFLTHLVSKG